MTDPGRIDRPPWGSLPLHDAVDAAQARTSEFHCALCALEAEHGVHTPATLAWLVDSSLAHGPRQARRLVKADPAMREHLAAYIGFGVLIGQALRRPDEDAER